MDDADLRVRVLALRDAMGAATVDRADAVEALVLGLVCQEHVLFLGPPGTGKSYLTRLLTKSIAGAAYFETLLTKFSTEDEVCGAIDIAALRAHNVVRRNTAGMLPSSDVAFVDETFKANAAILNALLSVMNERLYKGAPCPLRMMVGASNELPQEEELGAFYDRFLIRHVVGYVESGSAFKALLRSRVGKSRAPYVPPVTITVAEWDAIRAEVERVDVPDRIIDEMERLRCALAKEGIVVSDRRYVQCMGVMQGAAWLDGATSVDLDHLEALRFCLWSKPEEIPQVAAVLRTVDMGPLREAIDIIDVALRAFEGRPTDPAKYYAVIPALTQQITDAGNKVKAYKGKLSKRAQAKVEARMVALKEAHTALKNDLASRYNL